MFENHISITYIHETFLNNIPENFHFKEISKDDVRKEMCNLNVKNRKHMVRFPSKQWEYQNNGNIKTMHWCLFAVLSRCNHLFLRESTFPEELKHSEVIPVDKKRDPLKKENCRPVSLLPHASKVFDRIIYQQINTWMKNKLSECLTGFRKSHGTQHLLVAMPEKW